MILCRVAFLAYLGLATFLLLIPHPWAMLGLEKHEEPSGEGRGCHLLLFAGMSVLAVSSRWSVPRGTLVGLLILHAVATEGLQGFVPPRTPDALDLLENVLGIAAGLAVCLMGARIHAKLAAPPDR